MLLSALCVHGAEPPVAPLQACCALSLCHGGPGQTFLWILSPDSHLQKVTTNLTVVYRFSKMVHFIPLPKLPSAKEMAEIMLHHVFHLHGLPRDIVSDQGPQYVAQFWQTFYSLLGATASLSSGYHPQSNGQNG